MINSQVKLTKVLLLFIFLSASWSCIDKDEIFQPYIKHEITACGVDDPLNNLAWLNEIVNRANNGELMYIGTIWLTEHEGQELIVTDMSMGSGGIAYYVFDCSGEIAQLDYESFRLNLSDEDKIYSNMPDL